MHIPTHRYVDMSTEALAHTHNINTHRYVDMSTEALAHTRLDNICTHRYEDISNKDSTTNKVEQTELISWRGFHCESFIGLRGDTPCNADVNSIS